MKPVCKYYRTSECLNPNCRFAHPAEYPVYIYTAPGIEIHPDELRFAVMGNEEMVREADNAWLSNYAMFCQEDVEKDVDILECPDYFCMPFDLDRVGSEIENLKKSVMKYPGGNNGFSNSGGYRQYDNRRQPKPYGGGRTYDDGRNAGRGYADGNRGGSDSRAEAGRQSSWYSKARGPTGELPQTPGNFPSGSGGYPPRIPNEHQRDNSFGNRPSGFSQQNRGSWRSNPQDQGFQPRYGQQGGYGKHPPYAQPRYDRQGEYGRSNDMPQQRSGFGSGNSQSRPGMNAGYQGFTSPSDHPNGFDRASDPSKKNVDSNDTSPDYEYHNIPYNYK